MLELTRISLAPHARTDTLAQKVFRVDAWSVAINKQDKSTNSENERAIWLIGNPKTAFVCEPM